MTAAELSRHMEAVARYLLGEPNEEKSSKTELRFGNHGSLSVDPTKGIWHDFETNEGGGVLALIERETGRASGAAVDWLRDELGIEIEPKPNGAARGKAKLGRFVCAYDYVSENGELLFQVCRFADPKDFRQRRPDPTARGGYTWKVKGTRMVPYNLPEVLAAERVFVVEGEKDADNLVKLGLAATCNPGGAAKPDPKSNRPPKPKWPADFARYFAGKHVVILPDNDDAGRAHAEAVARNLLPVAASIKVVELPGLRPKGDVSDWLAAGGTVEALRELVEATPAKEPPTPREDAAEVEGDDGRELIKLAEGRVNAHARQCARLLDREMFLRGPNAAVLVRVEEVGKPAEDGFTIGGVRRQKGALIFATPTPARVQYRLDEMVRFQKYDRRAGQWFDKSCPPAFAERIIAAAPELGFRPCAGIVAVPLFVEGKVIAENGYHAGTGAFLDLNGELPPIPERPTKADAITALNTLLHPFRGYLAGNAGEALARMRCAIAAAALTAVLRPSLNAAPAILLDGNVAGAGKGKMGRALAVIGAGRHPAVITEGHSDEETEKRLASAVLGGSPVLLLDNLQRMLATSTLESGLTEPVATIRLFGKLGDVTVPFSALVIITANNAALRADMLRRTLPVRIIAATEDPETRVFGFDPCQEAKAHRLAIVAAGMAIARAWWLARESEEGKRIRKTTLGSFEQWADLVAGAVEWLTGMNPVRLIEERKQQDPKKGDERRMIAALVEWQAKLPKDKGGYWKAKEAATADELSEAWSSVLAFKGDKPDAGLVGYWLRKRRDGVFSHLILEGAPDRKGVLDWTVRGLDQKAPGMPGIAGDEIPQTRKTGNCEHYDLCDGGGDSFGYARDRMSGNPRHPRQDADGEEFVL